MKRIGAWFLFALFIPIHAFPDHRFAAFWEMSENQLRVEQGGRANAIAVNPLVEGEMFVTSDSGGLFKSITGGLTWDRIDELPVIFTQDVAYLDSHTLLVTAKADFKTANGGGLWRSDSGGDAWAQVPLPLPDPSVRVSGYGISVGGGGRIIAVGTSVGVFVSTNGGSTWRYSNIFGGPEKRVFSVLVESGSPYRIYAAGQFGVRVATTDPPTWVAPGPNLGIGSVFDIHALGKSPLSNMQAYAVNSQGRLYVTENGGTTWSRIDSAGEGHISCRGTAFLKAQVRSIHNWPWLELYLGNGCGLSRKRVQLLGTPSYSGSWETIPTGTASPRDLALDQGDPDPVLLATTQGLHRSPDGGATWAFIGGGGAGYNALQIQELKGQWVDGSMSPDLYVGTQDTGIWAAVGSGTTHGFVPGDGFFIDAEPRVGNAADSQVTFSTCHENCNEVSGRRLANPMPWEDAPNSLGMGPVFLRRSQYVQNTGPNSFSAGLDLTKDSGDHWKEFVRFTEWPAGLPKVARTGEIDLTTVLYQPFRVNIPHGVSAYRTRLLRIESLPEPLGNRVVRPAMGGFGGLAFNQTPLTSYQVFGADPGNGFHLIAPDVIGVPPNMLYGRMMATRDGGENWYELPALTDYVTNGGAVQFRADMSEAGVKESSNVSAISFCPDDPSLVLVGTVDGGIFYSGDNGETWEKIEGTSDATYVTSFYWQDANTVYVSTFGRGLWKLVNRQIAFPEAVDMWCGGTCNIFSNDGTPGMPRFDGGVFAFGGEILGVRAEKGVLREVFVTPGSSVVFTGDPNDPQQDIAITISDGKNTKELEPLPKGPDGWIITGAVFTKGDALTGTVFAGSAWSLTHSEK